MFPLKMHSLGIKAPNCLIFFNVFFETYVWNVFIRFVSSVWFYPFWANLRRRVFYCMNHNMVSVHSPCSENSICYQRQFRKSLKASCMFKELFHTCSCFFGIDLRTDVLIDIFGKRFPNYPCGSFCSLFRDLVFGIILMEFWFPLGTLWLTFSSLCVPFG